MKYRMSEGMTNIGTVLKEAMERTPRPKEPEQEPVAMKFKIYKPTVPDPMRRDINDALLPWVYDQSRDSGFVASMWVTPVSTLPPQRKEPEQWGTSSITNPEYVAEQKRKTEELRAMVAQPEQEPVKLRRGDILRCIETDELCTVWFTSTTGKTRVKWSANNFGDYTKEQIGELFWLETEPDDLELAAEKSDNYAAFHAGYRFAVAHHLAQPEQEPVATLDDLEQEIYENTRRFVSRDVMEWMLKRYYTTPPQRKPLTDEQIDQIADEFIVDYRIPAGSHYDFAQAIEAAHGIKG